MKLVCSRIPLVFRRRFLKKAILDAHNLQRQYNSKQRLGVIDVSQKKDQIIAWEMVEELSSELHRYKQRSVINDPLEEFCEKNQDALECRIYDV